MTTKELIQSEIENVHEEDLDELYRVIRRFTASKAEPAEPGLMARLSGVTLEAPPDFAANLELYLSGEKRVAPDIR